MRKSVLVLLLALWPVSAHATLISYDYLVYDTGVGSDLGDVVS
jgi:hypothetical protein